MKLVSIKHKKEISNIFSSSGFSVYSEKIKLRANKTKEDTKFLLSIPNSKLPRAVDRNYVKRIMREFIRKSDIKFGYNIAVIYNTDVVLSNKEIEEILLSLFARLK